MNLKATIIIVLSFLSLTLIAQQEDKVLKVDPVVDPYTSRNPSMTEIGLGLGASHLVGDVVSAYPSGLGLSAHLRRSLGYRFSLRLEYMYSSMTGIDDGGTPLSTIVQDLPSLADYGDQENFVRNYESTYSSFSLQGVFNFGNVLFHAPEPKTTLYLYGGVGLHGHTAAVDAFSADNTTYNFDQVIAQNPEIEDLRDELSQLLDEVYETDAISEEGLFTMSDQEINLEFLIGAGFSVKLSDRINVSLDHRFSFTGIDGLDGFRYSALGVESGTNDRLHYTSIRLGINLGDQDKRSEPLYWVNPMNPVMENIAEVKSRPELDLTDTDGDGIIDAMDADNNTPPGAAVDTKGVALDSDNDGLIDSEDAEPYSPPGYKINAEGVALIPEEGLTEEDVNRLIEEKISTINKDPNWYLPMIHFDVNKYFIKPEFYPELHHVATVMLNNPETKIVASGHADQSSTEEYNAVLSWKRARAAIQYLSATYNLSRDRFILQYGGENSPLVGQIDRQEYAEERDYINRRVEFRIAKPGDRDMSRPEGPDAEQ